MPSDIEHIRTIKSNLLSYLATESASPKPSYSIEGQSVSWDAHRSSIMQQIEDLDELIAAAEGPLEVFSEGIT